MRVTIGMPVYNGSDTIAAALDSLLAQSVAGFELIISDNGSTDTTEQICRAYASRDARIRYIRQLVNLGPTMNFRHVLFEASTEYFMWAAADDLWAPSFIAIHLAALDADPNAVASQSRVLFTKQRRPSHFSTGTYALTGSMRDNLARFLTNPADNSRYYALFRTAVLRQVFPTSNFFALDWAVSAATLLHGTHLEIPDALMIRDSSDSAMYEASIRRDHRFLLGRLFPVLCMTSWLIFVRRIPLTGPIVRALFHLNWYMHLRFGAYRIGSFANQHLSLNSPLRRTVSFIVRPGLIGRLRRLPGRLTGGFTGRMACRLTGMLSPLASAARHPVRALWRAMPLRPAQREAVKRNLVARFGSRALRLAGATTDIQVVLRSVLPLPPGPTLRAGPEDIWRFASAVPDTPAISVVLVMHNHIEETLHALDALYAGDAPSAAGLQVIVVDNASTDITALALSDLPGLIRVGLADTQPFGRAACAGAARTAAPAIVLLEQGVIPEAGFVAEMLRGLSDASLVVPQLRDRQGFVRSIGGRPGMAPLPTEGKARLVPSHPFCRARADVYYTHGGLGLRAGLLPSLDRYADQSDLTRLSYVLTQCAVGATARYWPDAALYRLDDRHREIHLVDVETSATMHPVGCNQVLYSSRIPVVPTVLYVDADTPMPDRNAGSIETMNLMRSLQDFGFRVIFVPESNFHHHGKYTDRLLELGITALYSYHYTDMRDVLERLGPELQLVILCRWSIASKYLNLVRELAPLARVVFNTIDLNFLRELRAAELSGDRTALTAAHRMRLSELATIAASDATIVLSHAEREMMTQALPGARIHTLPMVRDVPERLDVPGFAERRDMVFVGTYQHPPNEDAVVYFVSEIWPLISARLPGARFLIAGSSLTPTVQALAGNGVEVLGFVDELDTLLARCRLTVAPVRFGAGLKGKLISAFLAGVPSVATPIAAEGFGLTDGTELLIADTPEAFAKAVIRLYEDRTLWEHISQAGFDFMRRECTIEANMPRIRCLLDSIGVGSFQTESRAVEADFNSSKRRQGSSFLSECQCPSGR